MAEAKTREEPLSPTMEETVGAAASAVTLAPVATPVPTTGIPTWRPVVADAKTKEDPLSPTMEEIVGAAASAVTLAPVATPVPTTGMPT